MSFTLVTRSSPRRRQYVDPGSARIKLDIGVYGARGIPSTYSGYETFLTVLLPELVKRGHSVTMYCRRGHVDSNEPYRGVRRVLLPAPESKVFETLIHGLGAAARARVAGHDVVLAVNVANSLYCLLARLTGQRTALNTDGQEWLRGKWGRLGKGYFKVSARIARFGCSALISDSVAMRSIYLDGFGADSTVIPYCWSDLQVSETLEGIEELGIRPRSYFLVGGRLNPENNIDAVVDAYLKTDLKMPIVVLGEANYDSPVRRKLEELARGDSRINFLGHITDRSMFAGLVRESTAYVHAHSIGGINPSLVEAMGCGARILAFDTVFNREALGDAGSYFHDFNSELPQLFDVVAKEKDAYLWRKRAAERALSLFDLPSVTDAHEVLFLTVCGSHPWRTTAMGTQWRP